LYKPELHGELKNRGYGQDPYSTCEAFMALVRWLRGYPDEAAGWSRQALRDARNDPHTNTRGYVMCFGAATFEALRGHVPRTRRHAAALIAFTDREGLPVWRAYARVLHGWTVAHRGHFEDGIQAMKVGLVDFEEAWFAGSSKSLQQGFMKSFLLSLLAGAHAIAGHHEEALGVLETARSFAEATGETFWTAELQRLTGEMLLQASRTSDRSCDKAEGCFLRAQSIAADQQATALELRAAMSLHLLWRRPKPVEARQVLLEVYGRFDQGFRSPDLLRASRLLNEVGAR
jgi:predicted ATPase